MNAKEIIQEFLKKNNYDGLCNVMAECYCSYENVAQCDSVRECCVPGFEVDKNYCSTCVHNFYCMKDYIVENKERICLIYLNFDKNGKYINNGTFIG